MHFKSLKFISEDNISLFSQFFPPYPYWYFLHVNTFYRIPVQLQTETTATSVPEHLQRPWWSNTETSVRWQPQRDVADTLLYAGYTTVTRGLPMHRLIRPHTNAARDRKDSKRNCSVPGRCPVIKRVQTSGNDCSSCGYILGRRFDDHARDNRHRRTSRTLRFPNVSSRRIDRAYGKRV